MDDYIANISTGLMMELNGFLSEQAVIKATSLSRTSLYRKRVAGQFPEPESISEGRIGYRIRDIALWLENPIEWVNHQNNCDISNSFVNDVDQ